MTSSSPDLETSLRKLQGEVSQHRTSSVCANMQASQCGNTGRGHDFHRNLNHVTTHPGSVPLSYHHACCSRRREADEAVILHITSVSIRANGTYKEVTIQAQIVRVGRSLSGLERGDAITVKYEVSTVPFPGPRPVPILRKNEVYPAFLNKSGNSYVPAAFGESFNSKPETPR